DLFRFGDPESLLHGEVDIRDARVHDSPHSGVAKSIWRLTLKGCRIKPEVGPSLITRQVAVLDGIRPRCERSGVRGVRSLANGEWQPCPERQHTRRHPSA